MELQMGYSYSEEIDKIIEDITLDFDNPGTVLFFSSDENFEAITKELHSKYPDSEIFGATTHITMFAGRAMSRKGWKTGVSAVALDGELECVGGIIEDITNRPIRYSHEIREKISKLSSASNTICFEVTTAFCAAEELILDTIHDALKGTDIYVAGSTCGCNYNNPDMKSYVSYNGRVYEEACIYMFIHNKRGRVKTYKQNMYTRTDKILTATSVDVEKRIVYEFNNRPAMDILARMCNTQPEMLEKEFYRHPLGRVEEGDINIVDLAEFTPEKGIKMHANVFGGTKVCIADALDYRNCLSDFVARIRRENQNPRLILFVVCISLIQIFSDENFLPVFAAGLNGATDNFMSISGYGEQLGINNLNKSMVAIVFE